MSSVTPASEGPMLVRTSGSWTTDSTWWPAPQDACSVRTHTQVTAQTHTHTHTRTHTLSQSVTAQTHTHTQSVSPSLRRHTHTLTHVSQSHTVSDIPDQLHLQP